jgi:hypothetical protein
VRELVAAFAVLAFALGIIAALAAVECVAIFALAGRLS